MTRRLLRYGTAIAAVSVATLLTSGLEVVLQVQSQAPFLLFFGAIIVAAWAGGLRPGLFSTALSALTVAFFFLPPRYNVAIADPRFRVLFVIFVAEGVLISVLCQTLRKARKRVLVERAGREEIQESQQEMEERFRATFEQAAVGIAHVALDGRWMRVNGRLCAIVGYSQPELIELTFQDITYPPDLDTDMAMATRMLSGEIPTYTLEKRYVRKDGALVWINLTASLVRELDGSPKYFIAIVEDISERKRTEQALQESEERFRSMADSSPLLMWVAGTDALCSFFNQPWLSFTGRTMEQEIGHGWVAGVHPDDRQQALDCYLNAFAARQPFQMDYRLRRHDGEYRWILDHGTPRLSPDGSFAGYIGSCVDITERKQLEDSQRFLAEASTVLISSLDYASTLDTLARLIVPRLADFCAVDLVTPEGGLRRAINLHADPAKQPVLDELARRFASGLTPQIKPLTDALETGRTVFLPQFVPPQRSVGDHDEFQRLTRLLNPCSLIVAPLIVAGHTLGLLSLGTTDSQRRYTEADVGQAEELARRAAVAVDNARLYQEAQAAIRLREIFLSIAAHELKTPLTAILGYAHVLEQRTRREQSLSERSQRTLQAITEQGERLNRLIETLLDLSRIQTGRLSVEIQPIDLAELARQVVAEIRPTLDHHTIQIRAPETLPIQGDPLRLEQVLHNLLHNAIKYSPHGGPVEIELRREDEQTVLSVSDQGIGIPEAAQPLLFQQFFRAPNVDPKQISGLGIGLFVINEIVARHGGTITVLSQENVGSTFSVRLPVQAASAGATDPKAARILDTPVAS